MVVDDIDIVDLTASGGEENIDSGSKRPITAISKHTKGIVSSPIGMIISCEKDSRAAASRLSQAPTHPRK